MQRRAVLLVAVCLLAACGSQHATHVAPAKPQPRRGRPRLQTVRVLVFDGDLDVRLHHAAVRLGAETTQTDAHGFAYFRMSQRRNAVISVSHPGYGMRALRERFASSRSVRVALYQPRLQWPMYGATPERTEAQTAIRVRPPFHTLWAAALGGMLEFPAVASDGFAYIGNAHGVVFALSLKEGRRYWQRQLPSGHLAASPAIVGHELVVHGMDGHVWVLDRRTGRILWRKTIGAPIESSPLVWRGVDYFGAWDGRVYALDLASRRFRWVRSFGTKITSSASLADGTLFIGNYAGQLLALSPRTGAVRWSGGVNGKIYGTPAVADGRVFVPSSDGDSLTAFTTSGHYRWTVHTGAYVYSSPAVWGGRVFFGSYNGAFYCVSARTGGVLWERSLGGSISGAAVVVDGVAYAASFAGRMIGVDARSGRVVFERPLGHYVPVSGAGRILLLHGYSALYGVEPRRLQ